MNPCLLKTITNIASLHPNKIRLLLRILIIKMSNNLVGNNQSIDFIKKVLLVLKLVLSTNTTEFLYSAPEGLIKKKVVLTIKESFLSKTINIPPTILRKQ